FNFPQVITSPSPFVGSIFQRNDTRRSAMNILWIVYRCLHLIKTDHTAMTINQTTGYSTGKGESAPFKIIDVRPFIAYQLTAGLGLQCHGSLIGDGPAREKQSPGFSKKCAGFF